MTATRNQTDGDRPLSLVLTASMMDVATGSIAVGVLVTMPVMVISVAKMHVRPGRMSRRLRNARSEMRMREDQPLVGKHQRDQQRG
jgi:Na+/H+ antiporter NhaC